MRRIGLALTLLTGAMFAVSAMLPSNAAYYATPARAGEILIGSLLAIVTARPGLAATFAQLLQRSVGRLIGPVALVVLATLWTQTRLSDPWLFPWATAINALASAALIAECCFGRGLRMTLRRPAFSGVGRISYSLYLVHWPVYLVLTPADPMPAMLVFACRAAVSVALALAVFRLVEDPVRSGLRWPRHLLPLALGGLVTAAVVLAVAFVGPPPSSAVDEQAIAAERAQLLALPAVADEPVLATAAPAVRPAGTASILPSSPTTTLPAPATLQRVLFVGDSTSWSLSLGVADVLEAGGVEVRAFPAVGCGIGGATPIRYLNLPERTDNTCQTWFDELPRVVERFRPDVVLVVGGVADLSDRQLPDGQWSHIGEPGFDTWISARMAATVELLSAQGAAIGWTTLPHLFVTPNPGFTGPPPFQENEPARSEHYNDLIRTLAEGDDRVELIDLATFLADRPGGEFADGLRPDGVHIDSRLFPDIADFLVRATDSIDRLHRLN